MLINELQESLDHVLNTITADLGPPDQRYDLAKTALQEGRLGSAINMGVEYLVPTLCRVQELELFDGKMRAFASGWSTVDYRALAHSLIYRALDVGSVPTMAALNRYVTESKFCVQQMQLIGGVSVSEEITLANGVTLLPFRPWEDDHRQLIPGADEEGSETTNRITAALVKRHMHPRMHERHGEYESKPVMSELWNFDELDDALLCISLVGPSGPAMLATSIAPAEWIPAFGGALGQHPYPAETRHHAELNNEAVHQLQRIHQSFVALPPFSQKRLRVPMRRLNLAMRRRWDVDAAIDIGIALEVLFADARPFDSSIGFTLRLRASRLLRRTATERLEVSQHLADLYKLRSSAAHTGELPKEVRGTQSTELLRVGAAITAEAIQHIILNGEPDWDTLIFE